MSDVFYTNFRKGRCIVLKAKTAIQFTLEGKNRAGGDRLCVAFNFGNNLLFTGRVGNDGDVFVFNNEYSVDVDFFTVDAEAFTLLQPVLTKGMDLAIHEGKRIIGIAKLLEFSYI